MIPYIIYGPYLVFCHWIGLVDVEKYRFLSNKSENENMEDELFDGVFPVTQNQSINTDHNIIEEENEEDSDKDK